MPIRVSIRTSGTKFCAQCSYWSGQRTLESNGTLVYENSSTGQCNKTISPRGPKAGQKTRGNDTCSYFVRFGV